MFVNNQEAIIHQIEAHADREAPNECCGLVLIGSDGFEYLALKNEASDPQSAFVINPIIVAQNYNRIAYVVHSHVNRPATPSAKDIVSCNRLKKPFFIISVPENKLFTLFPKTHREDLLEREFFYGANDCFTVVRDFYKSEFAIELHDPIRLNYGWWLEKNDFTENVTVQSALQHGFKIVDSPKHGDAMILKLNAEVPSHWGVYLGSGEILQNALNTRSRCETYSGIWRRNTICFLRHYERD